MFAPGQGMTRGQQGGAQAGVPGGQANVQGSIHVSPDFMQQMQQFVQFQRMQQNAQMQGNQALQTQTVVGAVAHQGVDSRPTLGPQVQSARPRQAL